MNDEQINKIKARIMVLEDAVSDPTMDPSGTLRAELEQLRTVLKEEETENE